MNKTKAFILIAALSMLGANARAGLKVDFTAIGGRVTGTVQEVSDNVCIKVNTVAEKVQEFYTGSKLRTMYETAKALKEDVATAAASVQDTYENTQKKINETSGSIADLKNNLTDEYEKTVSELTNSKAGQMADLTKQLAAKEQEIADYKQNAENKLTANQKNAATNLKILHEMYGASANDDTKKMIAAQISVTETELSGYGEQAKQFKDDEDAFFKDDDGYQQLESERKMLQQQLADFGISNGKELLKSTFGSMLKKDDKQKKAEYNTMIAENFLLPDEVENDTNVKRVLNHRNQVLISDIKNAFLSAAEQKKGFDEDIERLTRKKDNMAAVDSKLTSANLLIEQRIEDINILYKYTNLLIADMRLKTSLNVRNQKYRLENYDKDPAVLNLDNYIFTADDVPTDAKEKSFLDGVTGR